MWTQCLLKRNEVQTVCWIESKFARKNNILEDEGKQLWKVAETYSSIESDQLDMQNKTQREFEKKLK
jgi:hypothetical protein